MKYELAKKLKEAGWPQDHDCIDGKDLGGGMTGGCLCLPAIPTLSEFIEACGSDFNMLIRIDSEDWYASDYTDIKEGGSTPEEAVANLWLALDEK